MSKWFRDVILIPLVMSLAVGFLFMLFGALYSGVPWHSPFSPHWLMTVGSSRVPFWYTLLLALILVLVSARSVTQTRKLIHANLSKSALESRLDINIRAHDEKLFREADALLSEQELSDFLYRLQSDDSYYSSERFKLDQFAYFFSVTGNRYIDPSLLSKTDELRLAINELLRFTGQHFFVYPRVASSNPQSCLYPALNGDREGDYSSEQSEKYDRFADELDILAKEVRDYYRSYRLGAKHYLQV